MKKKLLLLSFLGAVAGAASAQIPAKATGTPQGKLVTNPMAKPAAGKINLVGIKLSPGVTRKLVTPPVMLHPPGVNQGEQTVTGSIPSEGGRAAIITISGTKFGTVQSDVQVRINNVAAIVTGMSDNQITCIVPDRCGSGPISVGVKDKWSSGAYFIYDWSAGYSTFAGYGGVSGNANGGPAVARFHSPSGMYRDASGNVYVTDADENSVRKINSLGEVTTFAGGAGWGYADGQGAAAKFYHPYGVASDNAGNVYVSDYDNHRIRKITPNGMVTTFAGNGQATIADGRGTAAGVGYPKAMAFDGTNLILADGNTLRKIDLAGNVTTIAGGRPLNNTYEGPAMSVGMPVGFGFVIAPTHEIYLACGTTVRCMGTDGRVRIIAGNPNVYGLADGYGRDAVFSSVNSITVDAAGTLYAADLSQDGPNGNMTLVRRVAKDGMVTTPSNQMTGYNSIIWAAAGMAADNSGTVYIADYAKHCIHKMILQ